MTALRKLRLVSVEEYLAGEEASEVKHEYLGGVLHAMAGGTNKVRDDAAFAASPR